MAALPPHFAAVLAVVRFEGGTDGLSGAETVLVEQSRCWRD